VNYTKSQCFGILPTAETSVLRKLQGGRLAKEKIVVFSDTPTHVTFQTSSRGRITKPKIEVGLQSLLKIEAGTAYLALVEQTGTELKISAIEPAKSKSAHRAEPEGVSPRSETPSSVNLNFLKAIPNGRPAIF